MPLTYTEPMQTDNRPCSALREDLKKCLLESDCVKNLKRKPKECLLSGDPSVPEECHKLRVSFFECKRSLLDNRRRFRGRREY